jgi:DNA-binding response OmpR family regulator
MSALTQKLHTSIPTPESIPVLVVSPLKEDHLCFSRILKHGNWKIVAARTCREADELLHKHHFAVVVAEEELPDGNWHDVVRRTSGISNAPAVLVISSKGEYELWADVLENGGYDVLPKPLDSREVMRVIGMAWRHSLSSWLRPAAAKAACH